MSLSLEQGRSIAAQYLRTQAATSAVWRRYQFATAEETSLFRETAAFWVFFLPSSQLSEAGHVPGGLLVGVDKNDGHIWSAEAQEIYFAAQARTLAPQPACAA